MINNVWKAPAERQYKRVFNPATKETIHYYPAATSTDVDEAVAAANKAFPAWSQTSAEVRAKYLNAIADKIEQKADFFARLETTDSGKPIAEAQLDVGDVANCFRFFAKQAIELEKKQGTPIELPDKNYTSQVRYEPVGVAGLIIPWNYPLLMVIKPLQTRK